MYKAIIYSQKKLLKWDSCLVFECFDHIINTCFKLLNKLKECALNWDLAPPFSSPFLLPPSFKFEKWDLWRSWRFVWFLRRVLGLLIVRRNWRSCVWRATRSSPFLNAKCKEDSKVKYLLLIVFCMFVFIINLVITVCNMYLNYMRHGLDHSKSQ